MKFSYNNACSIVKHNIDLEAITIPFSLLSNDVSSKLESYGGQIEVFTNVGWQDTSLITMPHLVHRAKHISHSKTLPSIPWDAINIKWKYAVKRSDNAIILFDHAPHISTKAERWEADVQSDMITIYDLFKHGTCDWQDSLVIRHNDTLNKEK